MSTSPPGVPVGGPEGWEALLLELLSAPDPARALEAARQRPSLEPPWRAALERIDPPGLRLSALLIAKLRFERLLQGSERARVWFEEEPAAFASAFRAYQAAVPATAYDPFEEARLFEDWAVEPPPRSS